MHENRYSSVIEENIVKPIKSKFEHIGDDLKNLSTEQDLLKKQVSVLNTWLKVVSAISVLSLFLNILLIFYII